MPDPDTDYDRGHLAGEIAARLAGHDAHFAAINGHLATLATDVHHLGLQVQRLADQRGADAETVRTTADAVAKNVKTTADAVEESRVARRDMSDRAWSPWHKVFVVLGGLAALAGVTSLIVALLR